MVRAANGRSRRGETARNSARGLVAAALVSLSLAGCAGDPDATLIGVVMVPPNGTAGPSAGPQPYSGTAVAGTSTHMRTARDGLSGEAGTVLGAARSASAAGAETERSFEPIGYAEPAGAGVVLKSDAEVTRTEAELRNLAQRNAASDGRGLWNSKMRDLLTKRDHHIDDAIKKIESDDASE